MNTGVPIAVDSWSMKEIYNSSFNLHSRYTNFSRILVGCISLFPVSFAVVLLWSCALKILGYFGILLPPRLSFVCLLQLAAQVGNHHKAESEMEMSCGPESFFSLMIPGTVTIPIMNDCQAVFFLSIYDFPNIALNHAGWQISTRFLPPKKT